MGLTASSTGIKTLGNNFNTAQNKTDFVITLCRKPECWEIKYFQWAYRS